MDLGEVVELLQWLPEQMRDERKRRGLSLSGAVRDMGRVNRYHEPGPVITIQHWWRIENRKKHPSFPTMIAILKWLEDSTTR